MSEILSLVLVTVLPYFYLIKPISDKLINVKQLAIFKKTSKSVTIRMNLIK